VRTVREGQTSEAPGRNEDAGQPLREQSWCWVGGVERKKEGKASLVLNKVSKKYKANLKTRKKRWLHFGGGTLREKWFIDSEVGRKEREPKNALV